MIWRMRIRAGLIKERIFPQVGPLRGQRINLMVQDLVENSYGKGQLGFSRKLPRPLNSATVPVSAGVWP